MVVVQGCTLQIMNGTGTAQITTPPSSFVTACDKAVYRGQLQITVAGFEGTTITGGTGTGVLQPNVTGTKVDNMFPFKEGAQTQITCTGSLKTGTGTGTEVALVQITDAGQQFVKFE